MSKLVTRPARASLEPITVGTAAKGMSRLLECDRVGNSIFPTLPLSLTHDTRMEGLRKQHRRAKKKKTRRKADLLNGKNEGTHVIQRNSGLQRPAEDK